MESKEKSSSPLSGYVVLTIVIALILGSLGLLIATKFPLFGITLLLGLIMTPGFFFVNPNGSVVLVLFGKYKGTVKENGFFWVNPFYYKKKISLRARNFDSARDFFTSNNF